MHCSYVGFPIEKFCALSPFKKLVYFNGEVNEQESKLLDTNSSSSKH